MTATLISPTANGRPLGARPRIRVVVVDADPDSLARLATAVRADPSLEVVAASGDSGAPVAVVHPPDVVLMDSAAGAEGMRRFRQAWPEASILALSSGQDAGELVAMLAEGAVGCVRKDAAATAVAEAVRELPQGRIQFGREIGSWLFGHLAELLGDAAPAADDEETRRAVVQDIIDERRFTMVFQPIVDLATGALVGVEALARFLTEERRSPDVWLAEAQAVGLRTELEHELLREAVAQAGRLPSRALLTVNLSPTAAISPDLRLVVPERHLPRLVIEITEHRQVEDYESLAESLVPLRAAGLRVAVDDSGQGLSSLQQVLQLAPDFIKLNRTLVRDIESDPIRRALAFALTSVASQVGASVVAEGIETTGELEALRSLGVGEGQGYLISRPQSVEELPDEMLALPEHDSGPATPFTLSPRAGRTLHDASRAAFELLAEELPGSQFFISQLDYRYRRFRIVTVSDGLAQVLPPGFNLPATESLCYRMASGQGARVCNDVAADPLYGSLPLQSFVEMGSYVGVPLETPGGPRLGSLCAISKECDRYDERSLELLQTVALPLVQALSAEAEERGEEQLADHLRRVACSDRLTEALNAPSFMERVARDQRVPARERERRYLLHLSIPNFEAVQQQHGRAVVELVLMEAAEAMAAAAEPGDTVGRIGEAGFAALLVNRATPENAGYTRANVAERLREAFSKRGVVIKVEAGLVPLTADAPERALDAAMAEAAPLL